MNTLILIAALIAAGPAAAGEVTGEAFFRERIALPPGARFEAALEDVSRADAPSRVISRDGGVDRPGPPFAFALPYDPAQIDPRAAYNVRARITVGDRLMFTTDTAAPVITRGAPTEVDLMMVMVRSDPVPEPEPEAAAPEGLRGMVTYMADAALFAECLSGETYPVAMEADFPALERAVIDGRAAPGTPILATIEGGVRPRPPMEGEGEVPTVVVDRFVAVWPQLSCDQAMADADLTDTYWRILRLGDAPVGPPQEGRREAHLILRGGEGRYAATVGCNQLIGGYDRDGARLGFGMGASTMMACPPPLDAEERALARTLAATAAWRVNGNALELFDGEGAPIALFEAVHLN